MGAESLRALAEKWAGARAAERANSQSYFIELCHALGVEPPGAAGSGYQFKLPVKVITRDGVEVSNFLDCALPHRDGCGLQRCGEAQDRSSTDW